MVLRQKILAISKFSLTMFSRQQLEKLMQLHDLGSPGTIHDMETTIKRSLDKPDEDEQSDLSYTADQLVALVQHFHLGKREA